MECRCMTSAAEHRRPAPSQSEAILNALPNPVLLVAPDGKIVDANMAAESFFEISAQFLQRQSLKELVPFGSPLLALIDQVRSSGSPVHEHKVGLGTPRVGGGRRGGPPRGPPGRPSRGAADGAARPYRGHAAGTHHRRQDGPATDTSQRRAFGDRT